MRKEFDILQLALAELGNHLIVGNEKEVKMILGFECVWQCEYH